MIAPSAAARASADPRTPIRGHQQAPAEWPENGFGEVAGPGRSTLSTAPLAPAAPEHDGSSVRLQGPDCVDGRPSGAVAICDCCQQAAPVLDDGVVEMCGRCTFAQLAATLDAWGA